MLSFFFCCCCSLFTYTQRAALLSVTNPYLNVGPVQNIQIYIVNKNMNLIVKKGIKKNQRDRSNVLAHIFLVNELEPFNESKAVLHLDVIRNDEYLAKYSVM